MPRKRRVVEHLAAIGIDHIFGVDGANIEDLYDAAHSHPGITAVLANHEFSAATMADGYSRSGVGLGSGLGVVAATSGGGALNPVAGLGERLASVQCAADEIPPFAPFLTGTPAKTTAAQQIPTAKENRTDVAAST